MTTIVTVIWNDAHQSEGESTLEEIRARHRPSKVHTKGEILFDDEVGITIAGEWLPGDRGGESTYRTTTFVPRGMVVEVQRLKRAPLPKVKPSLPKLKQEEAKP